MNYTEKNIELLLRSGLGKEYQLDEKLKEDSLELLLQKVASHKKTAQPKTTLVVAFSVIWVAFTTLFLSEIHLPDYLIHLIRTALVVSLVFIPGSSFILIILKTRKNEEKLV